MGNAAAAASRIHDSDDVQYRESSGVQEDPQYQNMERIYKQMIDQSDIIRNSVRSMLTNLRILVVGRSGCGKTTLIQAMLGSNGPCSIAHGKAGSQNILTEWRYPDLSLPLVIHDSNGIDTAGNKQMAEIREFLDTRQKHRLSKEFAERVHAVWYVFSAMDDRVLEDCGLLEMLDSYGRELPLLLIMTNDDVARQISPECIKVDDDMLKELLQKIKGENKREMLLRSMVRVGNRIKRHKGTGEIITEESVIDAEGMRRVSDWTNQLMDSQLWPTWVTCQAIDMMSKLKLSAKLIVRKRKQHAFAISAAAVMPLISQAELATMFLLVTLKLTKIWNVSENLGKAITHLFLLREGGRVMTENLPANLAAAALLGVSLTATVLTGGLAGSTLIVAGPPMSSQVKSTSRLLMSYLMVLVGYLMYVHTKETSQPTDGDSSLQKYKKMCYEFRNLMLVWEKDRLSKRYTSLWDMLFDQQRQCDELKDYLVNFLENMVKAHIAAAEEDVFQTPSSSPPSQTTHVNSCCSGICQLEDASINDTI